MKRLLIALAAFVFLHAAALAAPQPSASAPSFPVSATPDPSTNPVMAALQKMGAKFYYLGKSNGLDGWFIVKDGQVQILYPTPDNKATLVGALFGANGDNITISQVARLVQGNKEVADLIAAAQKEQQSMAGLGSPIAAPAPATAAGIPTTSLSPSERLMRDLSGASTVVIGPSAASPEIFMVMDTDCPHCQATWKVLRDQVLKGTLHIRMVPVAPAGTDSERSGAMLLGVSDPTTAWDKWVAGDKAALAGTPITAALVAMRANHILIDNWKIQETPYIVYRATDGKVKVLLGEPAALPVILKDLGL